MKIAAACSLLHHSAQGLAGEHPAAIKVNFKMPPPEGSLIALQGEDGEGYPVYVSQGGETYYCHESTWPGWYASKGSCTGQYEWTTVSQESELIYVDATRSYDNPALCPIVSFEIAADPWPSPTPDPDPWPSPTPDSWPSPTPHSNVHDPKYGADLFTDYAFPPDLSILGTLEAERPELLGGGGVEWVRALDINGGDDETLFKDMTYTDPKQGAIGDCWLIASMAAAAVDHADCLKNHFREKSVSPSGKYTVKFWDVRKGAKGEWVWVTVDDWLPCQPRGVNGGTAKPLFSSFEHNEIWPMIYEKAFAKFLLSYDQLIGGNGVWAWQAMGICQDVSIISNDVQTSGSWTARHNDIQRQRELMAVAEGERRTMGGLVIEEPLSSDALWTRLTGLRNILADGDCCRDNLDNEEVGLPGSHAYSILSALEVQLYSGEQVRLIRLRNPWGNDVQFKGDWGRNSPKWTEHSEVEQQIRSVMGDDRHEEDDGVFWMTFADFEYYYFAVEICNVAPQSSFGDEEICTFDPQSSSGHDEL